MTTIEQLENWVKKHGNGKFINGNFTPLQPMEEYTIPEDFGIQQVYEEIKEFIEILKNHKGKTILEIGLGYFGSTHFLWRLLFNKVITIEKEHYRVREFGQNIREYYGEWVLSDKKSAFLIGTSNDPIIVKRIYDKYRENGLDVLFIDGDHSYQGVMTDWLLYSPLVNSGGIIAFHDCQLSIKDSGASEFIRDLCEGNIDRKNHELHKITHSKFVGIGYYFQE